MRKVNLAEKLAVIHDHWTPHIVGELNGQHVKLAKVLGTFDWHHHEDGDELFLVLSGRLRIEFRDHAVELGEGEFCIVPRGAEHRPVAEQETQILLFEKVGTLNTGNVRNDRTIDQPTEI